MLNTTIDLAMFVTLLNFFNVHYTYCQIAGYTAGTINSFFLNKFWTFGGKANKVTGFMQIWKFLLVNGLSLAATLFGMVLLVDFLSINEIISKVVIIFFSQSINFFGYKYLVFKNTK